MYIINTTLLCFMMYANEYVRALNLSIMCSTIAHSPSVQHRGGSLYYRNELNRAYSALTSNTNQLTATLLIPMHFIMHTAFEQHWIARLLLLSPYIHRSYVKKSTLKWRKPFGLLRNSRRKHAQYARTSKQKYLIRQLQFYRRSE